MVKNFLFVLSLFIATIAAHLSYLYTHREFKPDQFGHPIVHSMAIDLTLDDADKENAHSILCQKFSYLGFGKQMTAYESEDHQYVIKFFNPRPPLKEQWFHSYRKLKSFCTFKWLSTAHFKRQERLNKIFKRHSTAFCHLKEETALVYVHLNASTTLKQTLEVADQDGSIYSLNLENIPFALQKKIKLAGNHLRELRDQNDQEGIKKAFEELRHLFASRSKKKFTDRIQTLNNNYGFLEGKAIQLDFGRIWKDENLDPDKETEKILKNIQRSWPLFTPTSER